MEFTGERVIPGDHRDVLQQSLFVIHQALYRFVAQSCRNTWVLDVGCGVGHGLQVLSEHGATIVVGVERARDAAHVAASLPGPLASSQAPQHILVGDALQLATRSHIFDVVCAIEVIEHLPSAPAFLDEVQRVLKPDGVCFFSTPNRLTHSPGRLHPLNPYHLVEYTGEEFVAILSRAFRQVHLFTIHIRSRNFLVRYQPAALRWHFPFPLAHVERYIVWHLPPWNRRALRLDDVAFTAVSRANGCTSVPVLDARCWGFLARCAGPKCAS